MIFKNRVLEMKAQGAPSKIKITFLKPVMPGFHSV